VNLPEVSGAFHREARADASRGGALAAVYDAGDPGRARGRAERMARAAREIVWPSNGAWIVSNRRGARIAQTSRGLRLERAHLGGSALYFARVRGGVVASSRMEAVLAALDSPPALDADRVALAVGATFDERAETVYAGVERVRSGEIVDVEPDAVRRSRGLPELAPLEGDAHEIARELRGRIDAAIARAVEGYARVGVIAGGGVDSSSILASAVAHGRGAGRRDVVAIALDFAGPGDDRPYMDALAAELGIVPIRVRPRACGAHVRRAMVLDALPYTWPTCAWELGLAEAARARGADIVLTGLGGDDILDGDPTCLADAALRGRVLDAVGAAARLRVPWPSSAAHRVYEYVGRPLLKRVVPEALRGAWRSRRAREAMPEWAGPALRRALALPAEASPRPRAPAERFARASFSPGLLTIADARAQLEVGTGIARAEPFLDPSIAELVARIDPELLFAGGRLRGLLRLAMAGRIPDGIRTREDKAGFEPAIDEMLAAAGGLGAFEDLAKMRALADLGIVEPRPFRESFARFVRGEDDYWLSVWPALACEAFALGAEGSKVRA
jgi:asparagine synthase (glutamine-hydrolysing)